MRLDLARPVARLGARLRPRLERGSAELGVLLVGASVVAGSLLGTGVARTAVDVTDGVTWLSDSPSGQVVEINPATLEPQASAVVGLPGQQLVLAQDRGRLLVTNRTTGALTSIDLATLLASGRRDAAPGQGTTVLLDRGRAFLVDRQNGVVANIDPVTLATRGRVWVGVKGLRDAAVDGTGAIWVAGGDDSLTRIEWSDPSLAFTARESRTLTKVGRTVRLVAHERGVTVVSPDTGAIIQVGTGRDLVSASPGMRGEIAPAMESASTLVPVSVPGRGMVVIIRDGSRVSEVSTTRLGCPSPGVPVELSGVVYVPCSTTGRVIRLQPDGEKAGPDILTGDKGAPELVVDDGNLLVNVPGSTQGVKVTPDGTTTAFVRLDETLTPTDVDRRERDETAQEARRKAEQKAREDRERNRRQPPTDPPRWNPGEGTLPTQDPDEQPAPTPTVTRTRTGEGGPPPSSSSPGPGPTRSPSAPAQQPPVITDVRPSGNGGAAVSWTQPGPAAIGYAVLVDGAVATRVGGATTSATLTGLASGRAVAITVKATFDGGRSLTSAAGTVTPSGTPGAPGGLAVTETARSRSAVTFAVSWSAAPDNGSTVTGYGVAASGTYGSDRWSGGGGSASVTVSCPASGGCGAVSISVTARNAVGPGAAATTSVTPSAPPVVAMPDAGATVVTARTTTAADDEYDLDRVTTLTLSMPASWASFSGTCQVVTANGLTDGPGQVPCNTGSVDLQVHRSGEDVRTSAHSVTLRATDPDTGRSVDSAAYPWTLTWPIYRGEICGGTTGRICP